MTGPLRLPDPLTEAQINERRYRHLIGMVADILGKIQGLERQVALIMASSHEGAEEVARFSEDIEERLAKIERRAFGFQPAQTATFQERSRAVKRRIIEQYRQNLDELRLQEAKTGFNISIINQIREAENKIDELVEELRELE